MLTCLKDYVFPFYGCNSPTGTPLSGLYVSNLPGITSELFSKIADIDQVTWSGVWNDTQTLAMINFENDIVAKYQERYLLNPVTQTVNLGLQYSTQVLTPNTLGTQNGILIETTDPQSQLGQSNMQNIYLQSVSFYYYDPVTATSSLMVSFIDADLGTTSFTASINQSSGLVQGWNLINIEQTFPSNRLYIFPTGTFTQYVDTDISNFFLDNYGSYNCGNGSWSDNSLIFGAFGRCGCQARINATTILNNQYYNLSPPRTTNTFGMSMQFSLHCSFYNHVCSLKNHFKIAWQYKLGLTLLDQLHWSPRLNKYTTIWQDKYDGLRNMLELTYKGGASVDKDVAKYGVKFTRTEPGLLETAMRGVVLNDYDCCLQCNDHIIAMEARM